MCTNNLQKQVKIIAFDSTYIQSLKELLFHEVFLISYIFKLTFLVKHKLKIEICYLHFFLNNCLWSFKYKWSYVLYLLLCRSIYRNPLLSFPNTVLVILIFLCLFQFLEKYTLYWVVHIVPHFQLQQEITFLTVQSYKKWMQIQQYLIGLFFPERKILKENIHRRRKQM